MLKPKPFKDAEVNPEPPKRDLRDFVELFFSFLWFHHKTFFGLILLGGLSWWIYFVMYAPRAIEPQDLPTADNPSLDVLSPAGSPANADVPVAQLDFSNAELENDNNVSANEITNTNTNPIEADTESTISPIESAPKLIEQASTVLETGTVDQLIKQSLKLNDEWGKSRPAVGLLMCSERAKIARRLLELELTDAQQKYALVSYIDSISLVDSLNVAGNMKLEGTRAALSEIDDKYASHNDATIRAKANLALIVAPMYDFLNSQSSHDLLEYQQRLNKRLDQIVEDQSSLKRLAELAVALQDESTEAVDVSPITIQLSRRLEEFEKPYAKTIGLQLKEYMIYREFDPATLVNRVQNDADQNQALVQRFFQTLENNPQSSQPAFEVAMKIVTSYQQLGKVDEAKELLLKLLRIADRVEIPANQKALQDALKSLQIQFESRANSAR